MHLVLLHNQINSEITMTVKSDHENDVSRSQTMQIPIRFVHYHLQVDFYTVIQCYIYKHNTIFIGKSYSLHPRALLIDKTLNVNLFHCYSKFPLSSKYVLAIFVY